MVSRVYDWKKVAEGYYEKSVTLAILVLLFMFLVSPVIEVKPFQKPLEFIEGYELLPDIKDVKPPPETMIKPVIEILIETDDLEDDPELEYVISIPKTILDPYDVKPDQILGNTPKFRSFEDPPIPIRQISPEYTELARKIGIEGTVDLEIEVFADGSVGAVNVLRSLLSGHGGLDESAIKAVKQWEFQPARSNGNPVAVWTVMSIEFKLE